MSESSPPGSDAQTINDVKNARIRAADVDDGVDAVPAKYMKIDENNDEKLDNEDAALDDEEQDFEEEDDDDVENDGEGNYGKTWMKADSGMIFELLFNMKIFIVLTVLY